MMNDDNDAHDDDDDDVDADEPDEEAEVDGRENKDHGYNKVQEESEKIEEGGKRRE